MQQHGYFLIICLFLTYLQIGCSLKAYNIFFQYFNGSLHLVLFQQTEADLDLMDQKALVHLWILKVYLGMQHHSSERYSLMWFSDYVDYSSQK